MQENATTALILAAGKASRMGRTKQLLDLGGIPLLERVIQLVETFSFTEILIVIGHEAGQVQQIVRLHDERCRWIVNADYAKGQSYSLKTGMAQVRSQNVMVFLGDQPFIASTTVAKIYEKGKNRSLGKTYPFVIRPIYESTPGHPVFFGNIKQIDLSMLSKDHGANTLIKQMDHYETFPVADDGSIFDIDTPDAYEQAKERWKAQQQSPKPLK